MPNKNSLLEIFTTKIALNQRLLKLLNEQKTIGLVPTMGALHAGHLSLIKKSKNDNDITIATIFVNPTQFNKPSDLLKYPRPTQADVAILENVGCDILFLPAETEMYSPTETWHYNVGAIANELEGAHRPGHFKGVTQIVYKLFSLIPADRAYFGQKDFQQFLVIKQLVAYFKLGVELLCCPIIRETDGLALSSRNIHLSETQRKKALLLSATLNNIKNNYTTLPLADLLQKAKTAFKGISDVKLDYIEIRDKDTLAPIVQYKTPNAVALIAAEVGDTRLIDNMMLD